MSEPQNDLSSAEMEHGDAVLPIRMLGIGAHFDRSVDHTIDLLRSYVASNPVPAKDLPQLIRDVHAAIRELDEDEDDGGDGEAAEAGAAEPAHQLKTPDEIAASITPDALISFIDGKPYKTLRRHLGIHGLDPYAYRQRFGLPADYPVTAASYSAQRSALAKRAGLGRSAPVEHQQAAE